MQILLFNEPEGKLTTLADVLGPQGGLGYGEERKQDKVTSKRRRGREGGE